MTPVKVKLPAKYGYNPHSALIISETVDGKIVVLLEKPIAVGPAGVSMDVFAVAKEKIVWP